MKIFQTLRLTLNSSQRTPSLDYWRGLAILIVLLYHFRLLPYGYLGVDLFFVLSGFLVSRILVDQVLKNDNLGLQSFFTSRLFKIWPSYFAFIIVGTLIASFLYKNSHPDQVIQTNTIYKYIFFVLNYRSTTHFSFDHVWSLCVEEHFYILLPLGLYIFSKIRSKNAKKLSIIILASIMFANTLKFLGYKIGFETFSATHNRIDALLWGTLTALAIRENWLAQYKKSIPALLVGILLLGAAVLSHSLLKSPFYSKLIFHSITPIAFSLMIFASFGMANRSLQWLRVIAYYSYNIYLWHMLFFYFITDHFGFGWKGSSLLLSSALLLGVIFTHLIEERAISCKDIILKFFATAIKYFYRNVQNHCPEVLKIKFLTEK